MSADTIGNAVQETDKTTNTDQEQHDGVGTEENGEAARPEWQVRLF